MKLGSGVLISEYIILSTN